MTQLHPRRAVPILGLALLLLTPAAWADGFRFGSYGRVGVGSDLRGGTPEAANVVSHGSRVVQPSYLEMELFYHIQATDDVEARTVTTLAFFDDLFHYTGRPSAQLALRNLYAEATWKKTYHFWVGSRMVRGDDIYLLDYWPLDDLNTLGGGARYLGDTTEIGIHAGANRLLDPFQYQEIEVPDRDFGETTIEQLDRQRFVSGVYVTQRLLDRPGCLRLKLKIYGEVQALPDGERRRPDSTIEKLPSDFGWSLGAQLGAWDFSPRGHANLFLRFSQGLTAYDELAAPFGFDAEKRVFPNAREMVVGVSANYEMPRAGSLLGGYVRRFSDGDGASDDLDDSTELIIDVRPYVVLSRLFQVTLDVSYQQKFPQAISPSALRALNPAVFQVAPMFVVSPYGPGSFSRPQLRLVYRAAYLNEGARDLYAPDDPRRDDAWVYYLGVQAEWWFNSTTYQ